MKLRAQYDHDERQAAFSPGARWVTAGGIRRQHRMDLLQLGTARPYLYHFAPHHT